MSGVVGAQQGWQDVHETLCPVGCYVAMNDALQCPLEAFHYSAFDVVILAGEEGMFLDLSSWWKGATCILVPGAACLLSRSEWSAWWLPSRCLSCWSEAAAAAILSAVYPFLLVLASSSPSHRHHHCCHHRRPPISHDHFLCPYCPRPPLRHLHCRKGALVQWRAHGISQISAVCPSPVPCWH